MDWQGNIEEVALPDFHGGTLDETNLTNRKSSPVHEHHAQLYASQAASHQVRPDPIIKAHMNK
jgi:predicted transcriptional regulator